VKKTTALLLFMGLVTLPVSAQQQTPSKQPALPAQQSSPAPTSKSGNDYIALNFTNVDVGALVKVMSELTRRNFILDERVQGKITIMTPTKISPDEAYQVFLSALEIKGFTAVEDGKVVRIIPTAAARQSGLRVVQDGHGRSDGYITKLIRLNFVNPQEIVRTITPLLSKDGNLIAYPTTNSVILTDSVSNIRKIETLLQALDIPAPEGKGKINVYYLRNANAEDIAKLMQALVSRLPGQGAGAVQVHAAGGTTILEGPVTITADKATNSLIIVGSRGDYETVKAVIQQLDIRRRQVYVEAAIIEMSLTKAREIGFEFQGTDIKRASEGSNKLSAVGGTNFGTIGDVITQGPAGLAGLNGLAVAAVKGVFTYNGLQFMNVGALLRALQTDSDINVLSTPNLLTMDNQQAEIIVGSNVPFITGQTQNALTTSIAYQTSVERKDVGITLKLTPQITSNDSVRLEIRQEITDIIDSPAGLDPNKVGPSTSLRKANTTVVVKDRQTMVIGGLIRDNVTSRTSKVPFLGDIPLLGWLFKSNTKRVEKTNLMIFITPHIIKTEDEAEELTKHKSDRQEKFRRDYEIDKKEIEPAMPRPPVSKEEHAPEATESEKRFQNGAGEKNGSLQTAPTGTRQPQVSPLIKSAPTSSPMSVPSLTLPSAPTTTVTTTPSIRTSPPDGKLNSFPSATHSSAPAEIIR